MLFQSMTDLPQSYSALEGLRHVPAGLLVSGHDHLYERGLSGNGLHYMISGGGGAWGAPVRRFAIGLGCEIRHARELVYADHMDLESADAFEPIGISCRICERAECHQRSVPPLERRLQVTPDERGVLPYRVG